MMKLPHLVLIGLPGSGKSTLGRALLQLLPQYQFIDTDTEIEKRLGKTVPSIFEEDGEASFRLKEQEVIRDLLFSEAPLIVATGGGLPCFHQNMDFINEKAISIYINPDDTELTRRLQNSNRSQRPMLLNKSDEEILKFVQAKRQERETYYKLARITLSGNNLKAQDIFTSIGAVN
jgi:shikimate kinase